MNVAHLPIWMRFLHTQQRTAGKLRGALSLALKERRRGLPLRRTLVARHARPASYYEIVNDEVVVLYVCHSARPRSWEGE
jgi:hypothetical protein